jgi:hypothetical protein
LLLCNCLGFRRFGGSAVQPFSGRSSVGEFRMSGCSLRGAQLDNPLEFSLYHFARKAARHDWLACRDGRSGDTFPVHAIEGEAPTARRVAFFIPGSRPTHGIVLSGKIAPDERFMPAGKAIARFAIQRAGHEGKSDRLNEQTESEGTDLQDKILLQLRNTAQQVSRRAAG